MQVLPFNYQAHADNNGHGFVYTVTLIRQAQQEAANTLLVDNGDLLCGASIVPEIMQNSTAIHPIIGLMNDLGYDAATLGNHDFDYGFSYLLKATMQADFPFVSANTLVNIGQSSSRDRTLFSRFEILERRVVDVNGLQHNLRIGITGFLPPGAVPQFDDNEHRVITLDIVEAAEKVVADIKAEGADIIVVLAHTGIGATEHTLHMENAVVPLAKINGIDAIVFGHRHQVFPGPGWEGHDVIDTENGTIHGTPMISPGALGSHLGVIDLELHRQDGVWAVVNHACINQAIYDPEAKQTQVPADPVATNLIAQMDKKMRAWIAQPVGEISKPLTSFFALASPSCAVQAIQRAAFWYVKTHFTGHFDPTLPLLASACVYKSGGFGGPLNFTHILPGELTKRGLTDLYPFYNHIGLLKVNGPQLMEWLERSASVFNTASPGIPGQFLKSSEVAAYHYETILGLDYDIDLSRPARYDQFGHMLSEESHRITNLTYQGKPIKVGQEFTLITNNFRQGGGGFYPSVCLERCIPVPGIPMQTVLAKYFKAHLGQTFPLEYHWRFTSIPNTRLTFRSSPKAVDYLPELSGDNIQALGQDKTGYQLFELIL